MTESYLNFSQWVRIKNGRSYTKHSKEHNKSQQHITNSKIIRIYSDYFSVSWMCRVAWSFMTPTELRTKIVFNAPANKSFYFGAEMRFETFSCYPSCSFRPHSPFPPRISYSLFITVIIMITVYYYRIFLNGFKPYFHVDSHSYESCSIKAWMKWKQRKSASVCACFFSQWKMNGSLFFSSSFFSLEYGYVFVYT